jgi:hypothetical protein
VSGNEALKPDVQASTPAKVITKFYGDIVLVVTTKDGCKLLSAEWKCFSTKWRRC